MAKFLASFEPQPANLKTLADVIKYTKQDPEERYAEYGATEWLAAERVAKLYAVGTPAYNASLQRRISAGNQVKELLDRYQCQTFLCSSSKIQPAMFGGCPTISIPIAAFPADTPVEPRPRTGLIRRAPGLP